MNLAVCANQKTNKNLEELWVMATGYTPDKTVKIWVNGELRKLTKPVMVHEKFEVKLEKGRNRIQVDITCNGKHEQAEIFIDKKFIRQKGYSKDSKWIYGSEDPKDGMWTPDNTRIALNIFQDFCDEIEHTDFYFNFKWGDNFMTVPLSYGLDFSKNNFVVNRESYACGEMIGIDNLIFVPIWWLDKMPGFSYKVIKGDVEITLEYD